MEKVDPDSSGIPLLYYTVADAVASLTRLRIRKDGPFLLERPRSPLIIKNVGDADGISVVVRVTCESWNGTVLTLPLNSSDRKDWLAWGEFSITYGRTIHPALSGKTVSKRIAPSFETSVAGLPMRYRIRTRVVR